ncbi:unnamed protein product [Rotaria sordida]|uniref:Uncharacterized protein n=1 Tax=Rotaria sordida TaxID=392033 RepID=A0A814U976_9BILA|nr:unnamed protein product [Rotaria sordida]CAF1431114.1 unnamed protein product [Rotaria sordida]
MINLHGLDKITFTIFIPLFESNTLTKAILNQFWCAVIKTSSISSRNDFYKCLTLMTLAQQGKAIDEKLLNNYVNRELLTPTVEKITDLEDRLIRLLRNDQQKNTLCFHYNDLCVLDTIQVDLVPEKKDVIIRHVEYEVTSMKPADDSDGIQMFRISQTYIAYLHQQLNGIRVYLKNSTTIDRWATGPNDYWATIQIGLTDLPSEMNAISERINERYKRDDEVINDHFHLLIDLLQGYKDLCRRFEEALRNEQKAIQKANNQQRRSSTTTDTTPKNDNNLETIEKRNRHGLKFVQIETQVVYANLEAFVCILNNLGNSQCQGSSDLVNIWKSFASKVSQLGQNYINKFSIQKSTTIGLKK